MALPIARAQPIAWVVAGAFFMETLDGTVIVTALPAIAKSYGVTELEASLAVSIYLVAMAMGVPAAAWLADRLGARRVFVGAVAAFSLASMLCAFAPTFAIFAAMRFVQGLAAAFMSPVGRLVVLRETPKSGLIEALGLITWPGLIAPVLGPALGGLVVTYGSWPWIFLVNVPLGLLAIAFILRLFPKRPPQRPDAPLDVRGLFLTALALACLVLGLEGLTQVRGGWGPSALLLLLGALTAGLALRHLRRHTDPVLDLRPLDIRSFSVAVGGAGFVSRVAINASPFLLPLMFQVAFGWSALQAGWMLLAYMAGNLAMKSLTTPILRRFGFRRVLLRNGALCAASLFAMAALTTATPLPLVVSLLVLGGMARSMNFTAVTTLAFADVPDALRAHASALATLLQQVAIVLGVALAAVVLGASQATRGATTLASADFQAAWLVIGSLMLVSLALMRRLPANAGSALS